MTPIQREVNLDSCVSSDSEIHKFSLFCQAKPFEVVFYAHNLMSYLNKDDLCLLCYVISQLKTCYLHSVLT